MRALLVVGLLLLAGCAAPADDGVWWARSGIQCEENPWTTWGNQQGRDTSTSATEPFERDARIEALVRDYHQDLGIEVLDVRAFFDDKARMAVCGSPDSWQFWLLLPEGDSPGAGWVEPGEEPEV